MPGTNLTRAEAIERSELINVSAYFINLDLNQGIKQFKSKTRVLFTANKPGAETFIDLFADSVEVITLNGESLDPASHFADSRISLPNLAAENELIVESTQAYTNTGEGLHLFIDPVDDEVYLYSQFEVPDARRVFASFEQPDLKSQFSFTVTAPAHWLVVSNQPTPEPKDAGVAGENAYKPGAPIATWEFEPTPIMSGYITAIVAGPYVGSTDEHTNPDGRVIPLGVYCRKSLHEYLDADYILDITKRGFKFFEKEFDFPYPFKKYDQIFCPEFNMGAMENIGAVTHTESYVFRGQVSDALRERRVVTVLHEMAHMWFGDLVTMKWWNDLWLNESFAEYTSILATAEATEWDDAWTTFASSEKDWAYRQDQLPSTHPIVAEIRDLEDVMTNFDGITYAKGAAVLKALVAYVGREKFMRGVHNYFVKHQYKNTELNDLLAELEAVSDRNLGDWAKAWLETAGVNTLTPEFTLDTDGRYASFAVKQTAIAEYPTLRPHRIAIGCYNVENGKLVRTARFESDVAGPQTEIAELVGIEQPDLLLLNDEDLSFAKVRFDERSLETALKYVGSCEDSLARGMIWGALWDITRDGEFAASRFVEAALANIASEDQSGTLRVLLQQLHGAASIYTAPANRERVEALLANRLLELTEQAPAGSDRQFQFLTAFAAVAASNEHLDIIAALLDGSKTLEGLEIDSDIRWNLLTALAAGGRVGEAEIAAALEKDNTANGAQSAAKARAVIPTAEAKAAVWQQCVETTGVPNMIVRFSALGFSRTPDLELLRPYVGKLLDSVHEIWEKHSFAIAEEIITGFYPLALADEQLVTETRAWLDENKDAAPALRRMLIENLADAERAVAAQKADA
ncbi:MAG: aminopeptidase N [Microbacteriaceae bacterium]|nr:aminopeptidase N [Microbacteriaceae bacterium]